jgi:hypothetical protein
MTLDSTVLEIANTLGIALTDIHAIYAEAIAGIAIINLIGFAIFCIAMIVTFKVTVAKIIAKNLSSDYESERERNSLLKFDSDGDIWPLMFAMVVAFCVFLVATLECSAAVQRFSYPEYFAIKEMLSIIGT